MTQEKHLVLYNDKIHSYPYVRQALIRFCGHSFEQAEQCVIIAHNVGKCTIKQGDIMEVLVMQENLSKLKLVTEVISVTNATN
jgi:ATP-dependent Clp protease adaptor protein ClpS